MCTSTNAYGAEILKMYGRNIVAVRFPAYHTISSNLPYMLWMNGRLHYAYGGKQVF